MQSEIAARVLGAAGGRDRKSVFEQVLIRRMSRNSAVSGAGVRHRGRRLRGGSHLPQPPAPAPRIRTEEQRQGTSSPASRGTQGGTHRERSPVTSADSGDMEQPVTSQGRKPSRRLKNFFRALSRVKRSKKNWEQRQLQDVWGIAGRTRWALFSKMRKKCPRVEGFLSPSAVSLPTAHAVRLLAWFFACSFVCF